MVTLNEVAHSLMATGYFLLGLLTEPLFLFGGYGNFRFVVSNSHN